MPITIKINIAFFNLHLYFYYSLPEDFFNLSCRLLLTRFISTLIILQRAFAYHISVPDRKEHFKVKFAFFENGFFGLKPQSKRFAVIFNF